MCVSGLLIFLRKRRWRYLLDKSIPFYELYILLIFRLSFAFFLVKFAACSKLQCKDNRKAPHQFDLQ